MLHMITSEDEYELLVLLEDFDDETRNAKYSTFSIGDAASNYQLTVGGYSGTAGKVVKFG